MSDEPEEFREPEQSNDLAEQSEPVPKPLSSAPSNDTKEMIKGIKLIAAFHGAILLIVLGLVVISFLNNPHQLSQGESYFGQWAAILMTIALFFECLAVIQFVYVLPAIIVTAVKKNYGMLKGIVIAMALTILLAGGSFALCTVGMMATASR